MSETPETPSQPPVNPQQPIQAPDEVPIPTMGKIQDLAIDQELSDSYLTYAMSTIVDRALPDVRDGLKPSQRRILVAMHDLNLGPRSKHRKCAKIAGDTSGNYHPHGEAVIYPTLVGMAQHWKMRYPMVDPQGNFGSIDPDPPAAMRYTEARMASPAADMLEDIELDTVDYKENYDGTRMEPVVLPSRFPNLLVNGGVGIAVGMATSLAPHNMGEMCDAITAFIDNPEISLSQLMQHVPGPDFPTGGIICGRRGIVEAYSNGRGRLTVRAKIHHEETRAGRNLLVITELPYQISKNDAVITKIKECVRDGRITDISNVVDESSNRSGMRLVIELKKGVDPIVAENQLYQMTPLQSTFSIINIALVKGQPQTLGLKDMIRLYVEHRFDVIRRRTAYRLRNAMQEAHRIEGLIYAVCDIDEVIKLIRSSRTREEAIDRLMARGFRIPENHPYAPQIPQRLLNKSAENDARLSRAQAEAIGRLQLIQLVGLEIEKLVADYTKLLAQIEEYEAILASSERVYQIIKDEVAAMRAKYADARRTVIAEAVGDLDIADLTPVEQVVVTITHSGYVKRLPVDEYRTQGRGGRGVIGANAKDDDFTEQLFVASTHDDLLCFTNTGRVFKIKVFEIPEAPRTSRGRSINNFIDMRDGERICEYMPIDDFGKPGAHLVFVTASGIVKRTELEEYRNVNRSGLIAVNLREGDSLIGVTWTSGGEHILLGTKQGMAIRFKEDDARAMGRSATGVKGIELAEDDAVVGLVRCAPDDTADLLTVTANGYGKRTPLPEYLVQMENGEFRVQGRGGKGRRDIVVNERNGQVVSLLAVRPQDDLMLISVGGMIVRINADSVRQTGRATQGVRVINLVQGDTLAGVARIADEDKTPSEGPSSDAPAAPESSAAPEAENA